MRRRREEPLRRARHEDDLIFREVGGFREELGRVGLVDEVVVCGAGLQIAERVQLAETELGERVLDLVEGVDDDRHLGDLVAVRRIGCSRQRRELLDPDGAGSDIRYPYRRGGG